MAHVGSSCRGAGALALYSTAVGFSSSSVPRRSHTYPCPVTRTIFQGVLDDIREHAGQRIPVTPHVRLGQAVDADNHRAALGKRRQALEDIQSNLAEINLGARQG